jgi:putative phosphoesterase
MRIGLMSDIHANLENLLTALALFSAQRVDMILCAGDLVGGGADGDEVVDLIRQREIPCVLGNHDEAAPRDQEYVRKWYAATEEIDAPDLLREETITYLKALPRTRALTVGEARLCVAHGTPWSNTTYLYPISDPSLFDRAVQEGAADVLILGHTHTPMCRQVGPTWIVNPGSVDGNRTDGRPSCAVMTLAPFAVTIYDLEARRVIRTCGE